MKNRLLALIAGTIMGLPAVFAADAPEVIYIGTWDGMTSSHGSHGVGTPVTPNADDPQLIYNSETQCYEGKLYDWAKSNGTDAWNAKIPYSVEGDVVTYYSGTTYPNINFGTTPTTTLAFTVTTDPSSLKGYNLAAGNMQSVYGASISLDLETKEITFTEIPNVSAAPALVNVSPVNNTTLVPNEDGSGTVILTFSGEVTTMRVIVEGENIEPESSENGKVWTITVPANLISESANSGSGALNVKIDQVYCYNLPVTFEDASLALNLSYIVKGVSKSATFEFVGDMSVLTVLENNATDSDSVQFLIDGDQVEISGSSYEFPFSKFARFLFTVPEGYNLSVASSVDSNDGANWVLGTAWSERKVVDEEEETINYEKVLEGTMLTIYDGADGATFTITIGKNGSVGVDSLVKDNDNKEVYTLQGLRVNNANLSKGIYIINGKKVIVK